MAREKTTATPLARGKITREGHFTNYSGVPRYGIGRGMDYRQRGGQWQVHEERQIFSVGAHNENFASWQKRIEAESKDLAEKTISLDVEHGYYNEEEVRLVIKGWRPADASEVKKIERQLRIKPEDADGK